MYWIVYRRYAPFESFGGGFEGDNRAEASTKLTDTARTIGAVTIAPNYIGDVYGFSSGSRYVGAGNRVSKLIGQHFSKVTSSVSASTKSLGCLRFTAQSSGSNPMIPAPAIDTFLDVSVAFSARGMQIEGTVRGDDFPNAEVFIVDRVGNSAMLFDFKTTGGKETGPITRLWGSHDKQCLGTFCEKFMLDRYQYLVGCAS